MRTQLIAALLISGAFIASPAFAGNNAIDAPFTSFQGVSTSPDASLELANAEPAQTQGQTLTVASQAGTVDQSNATATTQAPAARSATPVEGNGLMDRERP